jgi:hypothetical protein
MLLDKERNTFIHYHLKPEYPIPLFASAIIQKLTPFIEQAGYIKVIKTISIRWFTTYSRYKL